MNNNIDERADFEDSDWFDSELAFDPGIQTEPDEPTTEEIERKIQAACTRFNCDTQTAQTYVHLILEGYTSTQAKIMAGLADPYY